MSWSDTGGQSGSVFLLGYHSIEPGLQIIPRGRYGIRGVEERDGALKLAALAGQFVSSQGVEGMFGLFDGSWVGGHGQLVLTASGGEDFAP
jgi:hypothetical protein